MKLGFVLVWFISLMLNAFALDVVLNPYEYLNYEEINVYDYTEDPCECYCDESDF